MDAVTAFGVVENAGPNHLRGFLKGEAGTAKAIDIAVAFVTVGGLKDILPVLKRASLRGPVRLLTGLYQGFTDPKALRLLLGQQEDTEGRLSVRLSSNGHFHWKAYVLHHTKTTVAAVGSSNLTSEGLGQSGELNVVVTLKRGSAALWLLTGKFDDEWEQAVPLTWERVERYARDRPAPQKSAPLPLAEILGKVQKREPVPGEAGGDREPQLWRSWIDGYVSDATEQAIADTTDWDERDYGWYASGEPRHRRGDRMILFDHSDKWVRLVRIAATTSPPGGTPDGNHFTAYVPVKRSHKRRLDRRLVNDLVHVGLLTDRSQAKSARKMTEKTFQALIDHLRLV